MKRKGNAIVVTGRGYGIGRELVLNLLACGVRVVAIDINAESLQEMARQGGV